MADLSGVTPRTIRFDPYQQETYEAVKRAALELEFMLDQYWAAKPRAKYPVPVTKDEEKIHKEHCERFESAAAAFKRSYPTACDRDLQTERPSQAQKYLAVLYEEVGKCLIDKKRGTQRLAQLVNQFQDCINEDQGMSGLCNTL